MSTPKIASHEETLKLLTEKAREGSTSAMIALERALRQQQQREAESPEDELDRILTD